MPSMSRESSAGLEIVPPTNSRTKSLAEVMDGAYRNNHRAVEYDARDNEDVDADAEVDEIEEQPLSNPSATQPPTFNGSAFKACERCVRTNKICKGVAGARCDHCKKLKQKCSNSTGPARGKHAAAKKAAETSNAPKGAANKMGTAGPSAIPQSSHLKRKSPTKGDEAHNGDVDGHSMDGEGSIVEEDGQESSAQRPPAKKRRTSKGAAGPTRVQLIKAVNDIEGSIKRIQASVTKEIEKMNATIKSLNVRIHEMDEE